MTILKDAFGRPIRDLRISVTDRCNFRCFYCKSAHAFHHQDREELLTFEEIRRLSAIFVELGVSKLRITGGEPLLRRGVEDLAGALARIPGVTDLALTTNGFNFYDKAQRFKEEGLHRVTLSLDSLRPDRFQRITRSRDFDKVLLSIEAAKRFQFEPVKVNCVLVRGINDDEILDFADFARHWDLTVRFIEFMPIDEDEQWSRDRVVTGSEVLGVLRQRFDLVPVGLEHPSETARNYDFADGTGRIGLIMPVSRPFCGECSRIRLTADGKVRTCLFSIQEHDLKALLRSEADDQGIRHRIVEIVLQKEERHHINDPDFVPPSRSMSYIGG